MYPISKDSSPSGRYSGPYRFLDALLDHYYRIGGGTVYRGDYGRVTVAMELKKIRFFQHTIVGVALVLMGLGLYAIFMKPKKLPDFLMRFNGEDRRENEKI